MRLLVSKAEADAAKSRAESEENATLLLSLDGENEKLRDQADKLQKQIGLAQNQLSISEANRQQDKSEVTRKAQQADLLRDQNVTLQEQVRILEDKLRNAQSQLSKAEANAQQDKFEMSARVQEVASQLKTEKMIASRAQADAEMSRAATEKAESSQLRAATEAVESLVLAAKRPSDALKDPVAPLENRSMPTQSASTTGKALRGAQSPRDLGMPEMPTIPEDSSGPSTNKFWRVEGAEAEGEEQTRFANSIQSLRAAAANGNIEDEAEFDGEFRGCCIDKDRVAELVKAAVAKAAPQQSNPASLSSQFVAADSDMMASRLTSLAPLSRELDPTIPEKGIGQGPSREEVGQVQPPVSDAKADAPDEKQSADSLGSLRADVAAKGNVADEAEVEGELFNCSINKDRIAELVKAAAAKASQQQSNRPSNLAQAATTEYWSLDGSAG